MRLYLLDLLDTVLQHGNDGVLIAQPGQPATSVVVLSGFERQDDRLDRAGDLAGIGAHRAGHHDRIGAVGPQFDLLSRGPPVQQHRVTGCVQVRGDRRTNGTGADNCNIRSDVTEISKRNWPSRLGSRPID
jgi:hypothetical protein